MMLICDVHDKVSMYLEGELRVVKIQRILWSPKRSAAAPQLAFESAIVVQVIPNE
jgi:hypothetical protein